MMMRFSRWVIGHQEWEKPKKWSNDNPQFPTLTHKRRKVTKKKQWERTSIDDLLGY